MTRTKRTKTPVRPLASIDGAGFLMDAEGSKKGLLRITMAGIGSINGYGEEEMVFSTCMGRLRIGGQGLFCRAFQNGRIEVTGRVDRISFEREEGE